MPTYRIAIGDQSYRVESPVELTDQQAYDAARSSPEAIQAQNTAMRANMATQANAGASESPWTAKAMGERALEGVKGELEGAGGALAGLALMPVAAYQAIRHPWDTAKAIGQGGMLVGRMLQEGINDPTAALSTVADTATKIGNDPRMIGRITGATGVALATPALSRWAANTKLGQATGEIVSATANRIPGMMKARAIFSQPTAAETAQETATPAMSSLSSIAPQESPLDLTRRLRAENMATYAKANAESALTAPTTQAVSATVKPHFSADDVLAIQKLTQQGIPESQAIQMVQSQPKSWLPFLNQVTP